MRENPYKRLPPIERKQDGSLYRMTPAQRKQANALIRRECCCYEDGNCIVLDDGDTCACPQTASFSVCCKWFRWAVLPLDGTLEACGVNNVGKLRSGHLKAVCHRTHYRTDRQAVKIAVSYTHLPSAYQSHKPPE